MRLQFAECLKSDQVKEHTQQHSDFQLATLRGSVSLAGATLDCVVALNEVMAIKGKKILSLGEAFLEKKVGARWANQAQK